MQNRKTKKQKSLHDYEFALILGTIIGVFLLPVQANFHLGGDRFAVVLLCLFGAPILALAGLFITRTLFYRIKSLWQFTKFALVGVTNTAVNFGVLNLLIRLTGVSRGIGIVAISAVAFLSALVNSYIWNSHWSFDAKHERRTFWEFEKFFMVTFFSLLVNSLTVYIIVSIFTRQNPILVANAANVVAVLTTALSNFFGYKYLVFKK